MSAATVDVADLSTNEPIPCPEALLDQIPERVYSEPSIWLYRHRTIAMLKRYLRLSIEVGRMPSLLGREFFRSKVTAYKASSFEDSVIFVHDVERCLDRLDRFEKRLIATIVLQEYTHDEAAIRLHCWRRTVGRRFPEAIDALSELFLKGGLLRRLELVGSSEEKSCQEGKIDDFSVTDSEEAK